MFRNEINERHLNKIRICGSEIEVSWGVCRKNIRLHPILIDNSDSDRMKSALVK